MIPQAISLAAEMHANKGLLLTRQASWSGTSDRSVPRPSCSWPSIPRPSDPTQARRTPRDRSAMLRRSPGRGGTPFPTVLPRDPNQNYVQSRIGGRSPIRHNHAESPGRARRWSLVSIERLFAHPTRRHQAIDARHGHTNEGSGSEAMAMDVHRSSLDRVRMPKLDPCGPGSG